MSTNPINVRLPQFDLTTEDGRQAAHRYVASGIVDLNQAIAALNDKMNTAKTIITTIAQGGSGGGGGGGGQVVGGVNNQIGQTAYTTQQSDYGVKILLGDAAPVTVTLNAAVTTPWFSVIGNDSSATVSLVPSSGSLFGQNYVKPGFFGLVFFDGANFWSEGTPIAQDSSLGVVQGDGSTIHVDALGTMHTVGVTGTILIPSVDSGMTGSISVVHGLIIGFTNPT